MSKTMSETAHTPTPWHVGPYYTGDVESLEGRVAECSGFSSPRASANAAHIVRAVNAHGDLLAACKQTVEENLHLADGDNCTLIHLKRAIAKAEGR